MNNTPDIFGNLDQIRILSSPTTSTPYLKPKAKKIAGEFLKGPIPLPWLTAVSQLSGKSPLAVALALWFEAGRRKSKEVKLTSAILERFSVCRKAKYHALQSLEKAGLIHVDRQPRKNPIVTILEFPTEA